MVDPERPSDDNEQKGTENVSTIPFTLVIVAAALFIVIGGLRLGSTLVIPILMSLFIAILCARPVKWLVERGWNVTLAVCVVLALVSLIIGLFTLLIGSQFGEFSDQMPMISDRLSALYGQGLNWIEDFGVPIDRGAIAGSFDPSQLVQYMPTLLSGVGDTLSQTVIIVIMVVFMIYEILDLPQKLKIAFENPQKSLTRFKQFSESLQRYLIVKSEIGVACGVLTTLTCWVLGVEFALIWGVLAFLLNFIPNIGAFLSAIPPVLLALVMPDGGVLLAIVLGGVLGSVHFITGNIIEPRLMGHALGMSTLMAFMSLVVWGWVLGPVGLLLSVPLTMSLKILLDSHPDTRWLSVLIGPTEERRRRSRR
ncbi:AI-2E family transporter [Halotalea alkalilenta]|uniref:AI-2E family transporter n=1 Tax=Halotalea alkalilenta TaxID=376489 RepID=A0A172YH61_9GAMM|nr:AI-2E family transporter [Halotalea alkalilenta]ANF58598.1 AI-2E family transporter [Halotalea alkalilenta]